MKCRDEEVEEEKDNWLSEEWKETNKYTKSSRLTHGRVIMLLLETV